MNGKRRCILIALAIVAALAIAVYAVLFALPGGQLKQARELAAGEDFAGADAIYAQMGDATLFDAVNLAQLPFGRYREVAQLRLENSYCAAEALLAKGEYKKASKAFKALGDYRDAADRILEPYYAQGKALEEQALFEDAATAYLEAADYADAQRALAYCLGRTALEQEHYIEAEDYLTQAAEYADAAEQLAQNGPQIAAEHDAEARERLTAREGASFDLVIMSRMETPATARRRSNGGYSM